MGFPTMFAVRHRPKYSRKGADDVSLIPTGVFRDAGQLPERTMALGADAVYTVPQPWSR